MEKSGIIYKKRIKMKKKKKSSGKCPASGCIKKVGGDYRVISNKTGKLWPAKYKSRESARKALAAYHIN